MVKQLPVLAVLKELLNLVVFNEILHELVLIDVVDKLRIVFESVVVKDALVQSVLR